MEKTVIIIAGPTAVGKTAVAIDVARHLHTQIISADSRQCYRELRIGVARPTIEELEMIPHHFIASHSIQEDLNAASYEQFALKTAESLFTRHDAIVITGGTGLYIKAFTEGLDEIPAIDPTIREEIISQYESSGLDWLQDEIKKSDPAFHAQGEIHNPQRMMRALEVIRSTGHSILHFRKGSSLSRPFRILKIGIDLPRETLYSRINQRVDNMMKEGLLEEVKSLLPFRELNALQTVGYAELFDYLAGKSSLEKAIDLIKQHTRNYAKRQLTWFRKDEGITWFAPDEQEKMFEWIKEKTTKS